MALTKSAPHECSATQPGDHPAKAVVVPSTTMSRWPLILEARLWRAGMRFGMFLHRLAPPRPPRPSFRLTIPATLSSRPGKVGLVFYTPRGYQRGPSVKQRYPFMVAYHGGGFTLGEPEDDARWAAAVVKHCNMVVVCVGYRRAPEHPFPTAVEDGADAMLWLLDHAAEYSLDADRMGCSGFSAGANLALTSTLRLEDALLRRAGSSSTAPTLPHRSAVKLIVSFYPALDYTRCRAERIASCSRPEMTLPAVFTRLFDRSYLHPPRDIAMDSPYLSPGAASDELLGLLPNELALYLCQWDMLRQEGEAFRERMLKLGKNVGGRTIENVAHGFDRSPNPLRENKVIVEVYAEACANIKRVLGTPSSRTMREPDDSGSSSKIDILNASQTDN